MADQVNHAIKECMVLLGLTMNCYSSHSLRMGKATDLVMGDCLELQLQVAGHWKLWGYGMYVSARDALDCDMGMYRVKFDSPFWLQRIRFFGRPNLGSHIHLNVI